MRNPSLRHQKLVAALVEHFKNKLGYTIVSASMDGYIEPDKHGRYEPDIVAQDVRGVLYLAEAKVGNDILSETARERAEGLAAYIVNENKNGKKLFGGIVVKEKNSWRYNDNKKYEYNPKNLKEWKFLDLK